MSSFGHGSRLIFPTLPRLQMFNSLSVVVKYRRRKNIPAIVKTLKPEPAWGGWEGGWEVGAAPTVGAWEGSGLGGNSAGQDVAAEVENCFCRKCGFLPILIKFHILFSVDQRGGENHQIKLFPKCNL